MLAAFQTLSPGKAETPETRPDAGRIYQRFMTNMDSPDVQGEAHALINEAIDQLDPLACDLPDQPHQLESWMEKGFQTTTTKYSRYLEKRKQGGPRSFFSNRAHALYFLRAAAPTKLVDGAWLYGILKHWRNPKFADLLHTYLEELGKGIVDKNHVAIYKSLLSSHSLELTGDLDDRFYSQGLLQLALAGNAASYLPEIIGFNLGYEQLALHLLITAYELNEMGIDPCYFTLHISADNTDTGHARRAVRTVLDNLPKLGNADEYWRRVRLGYGLSNAGIGTSEVIGGFNIEQEVVNIFSRKSVAGRGVHSNYCRIAGRHVNDWLERKEEIPEFLAALQRTDWINRGMPVKKSRLWNLLEGNNADMFGVFTGYELQIIHDWIRGDASVDGRAYTDTVQHELRSIRPSYKVAAKLSRLRGNRPSNEDSQQSGEDSNDEDLLALTEQLQTLTSAEQEALLIKVMAPDLHWTPAGLYATKLFSRQFHENPLGADKKSQQCDSYTVSSRFMSDVKGLATCHA